MFYRGFFYSILIALVIEGPIIAYVFMKVF